MTTIAAPPDEPIPNRPYFRGTCAQGGAGGSTTGIRAPADGGATCIFKSSSRGVTCNSGTEHGRETAAGFINWIPGAG